MDPGSSGDTTTLTLYTDGFSEMPCVIYEGYKMTSELAFKRPRLH